MQSSQSATRATALIEIAIVLALFVLTRSIAAAGGFPFSGALAVVVSVIAIWALLKRRGVSMRVLGFRRPDSWLRTLLLNLIAVAGVAIVFLFVLQPLFDRLGIEESGSNAFAYIEGNPVGLVLSLLLLAWGTAAFGEEILARGFLLNRLTDALGGRGVGLGIALVLQAVLFGLAHYPYGARGILSSAVIALLLGTVYLAGKRNLWSVIPAHGIVDTISFVQTYQGAG